MRQFSEDIDLIVDEVFAEGRGHEGRVDDFDTNCVFFFVGCSIDFRCHALSDFSLEVIG